MPDQPDSFSVNFGSKLLFGAIMLFGLGVLAAVLLPLLTVFGPSSGAPVGAEQIIGAVMPGIFLIFAGLVLGIIAGIFLGYAHSRRPPG